MALLQKPSYDDINNFLKKVDDVGTKMFYDSFKLLKNDKKTGRFFIKKIKDNHYFVGTTKANINCSVTLFQNFKNKDVIFDTNCEIVGKSFVMNFLNRLYAKNKKNVTDNGYTRSVIKCKENELISVVRTSLFLYEKSLNLEPKKKFIDLLYHYAYNYNKKEKRDKEKVIDSISKLLFDPLDDFDHYEVI